MTLTLSVSAGFCPPALVILHFTFENKLLKSKNLFDA